MDMVVLKRERKLCTCCMEEHEVAEVLVPETNIFKGVKISYEAVYEYCEAADELHAAGEMISRNDTAMKDAYRKQKGLLTSQEIGEIRKMYGITQTDLSLLLGWGAKTITRYEGHQVQDAAYDSILRKLAEDPGWFLQLLDENKDKFSKELWEKYRVQAEKAYYASRDQYLQKALSSKYAEINGYPTYCGGTPLNIPKIKEVICYFAKAKKVTALFKVKLMKLMWYADELSHKRRGHSITGLAYQRLTMGAVPVGHKLLMELDGIRYEEIEYPDDRVGYKFLPNPDMSFQHLSPEDIQVLDDVIAVCGGDSKEEIVTRMHKERAYLETAEKDLIQYQYSNDLSIS